MAIITSYICDICKTPTTYDEGSLYFAKREQAFIGQQKLQIYGPFPGQLCLACSDSFIEWFNSRLVHDASST